MGEFKIARLTAAMETDIPAKTNAPQFVKFSDLR